MIRIIVGMFLVMGGVGTADFYDECLYAADCVAGPPPSDWVTIGLPVLGLILMYWGVWSHRKELFKDDDRPWY